MVNRIVPMLLHDAGTVGQIRRLIIVERPVRTLHPCLSSFSSSRVDEDWAPVWIVLPNATNGVYSRKNGDHSLEIFEPEHFGV